MKGQFARYGIPKILVSDNGPQYSCREFAQFANNYDFTHVTSSPTFAQSNGMAEHAVQSTKNVIKKALQAGEDPFLVVLECRNAPRDNIGGSPATSWTTSVHQFQQQASCYNLAQYSTTRLTYYSNSGTFRASSTIAALFYTIFSYINPNVSQLSHICLLKFKMQVY